INNSRQTVTAECEWSLALPKPATGSKKVSVPTGEQERIPLRFDLPATLAPGKYEIAATINFSNKEVQKDSFSINVLPRLPSPLVGEGKGEGGAKIALFDPKGETGKQLSALKVPYKHVEADADLAGYDVLIVGKEALTPDGKGPNVDRVRDGLKVIVFEQTAKVLEE